MIGTHPPIFSITFFPSWKHTERRGSRVKPARLVRAALAVEAKRRGLTRLPRSYTPGGKMGSLLPAAGFFALPFLPRLLLQLGRELVLGFADLIQQLVELLRRHLLPRRHRPQHVHQQQAHSDDLGQGRIVVT